MFNEYLEVIGDEGNKIFYQHIIPRIQKNPSDKSWMAEHQQRYKDFINFLNLIVLMFSFMIIEDMK